MNKEPTFFERNFGFIFVGMWTIVILFLFSTIIMLIAINKDQADELAKAQQIVMKKGVTCKVLLEQPDVKRIMGAR